MRKSLFVLAAAIISVFGLAAANRPVSAAAGGPAITFRAPSTGTFSATLGYTVNNTANKIDSIACTLARGAGPAVTASCGSQVATTDRKSTAYEVTLANLSAGSYVYSVAVTVGKTRGTASTTFTIVPVQAVCTVTPYHVTYDGTAHTATGSCTGVAGAALPSSTLDLTGTSHKNAGTYDADPWTFSDPSGNYSNPGGTVNDVIDPHGQTIAFGAAPADPKVGGSYTPSADATSGFTVSFSIESATAANCSVSDGTVSFLAAGTCTVDAQQAGDLNWAAAPAAQQTFAIASVATDYTPIPKIWINRYDDPQSPPAPPDPAVVNCPPQDLTGGGCFINALDGSIDNYFDASASSSLPAGADPSLFTYRWELFKPPTLGSLSYASLGIIGYNSPQLHIRPNSLPSLTNTALDVLWRVRLTITMKTGTQKSSVSFFQFDYQQSTLTLQMSTDCQQIGHVQPPQCTIEAENGLPAASGQATQTITLGAGPANPEVGGSFTPTATASSALPVTINVSLISFGVCSITGGVVTFDGPGVCLVDADQLGDGTWRSATAQWFFEITP